MQISTNADGTVTQYGESLGDLDGHTIVDISDAETAKLLEPGTKTWDGTTITVTPPEPVVEPDTSETEAQRAADRATILAVLPTQEAKDAMNRLLDSMLGTKRTVQ